MQFIRTSLNTYPTATFILALFGVLILPNLVMWLLSTQIFLSRSLINVDYLLLAAILIWLPGWLRWLGLSALCAMDFLTASGPAYHFSYRSMLQSVLDTFNLQPELFVPTALGVTAGSMLMAFAINKCLKLRSHRWLHSILFMGIAAGIYSSDNLLSARVLPFNFGTSTLGNIARIFIMEGRRPEATIQPIPPQQAVASDVIWKFADSNTSNPPDNILLVLVESWGVYEEEAVNHDLIGQFAGIEKDFRFSHGQISFKGSTVPGELRELCRLDFSGVHPDPALLDKHACLPEKLAQLGYESLGIHGYSGSMFKRREWYPSLFENNIWFVDDLDSRLSRRSRCGVSFQGICDTDLLQALGERAQQNTGKQFTFLLTLNSHLPVYNPGTSKGECGKFSTTRNHPQHCYLYRHMVDLFDAVKRYAQQNNSSTLIVLVGDHMPPFIKNSDRAMYDEHKVPYVILESRR